MKNMKTEISSTDRMWRTLVRVVEKDRAGVTVVIPGYSVQAWVPIPKIAIPPVIFKTMKKDARYHVQCNIGAKRMGDLCFDRWEDE